MASSSEQQVTLLERPLLLIIEADRRLLNLLCNYFKAQGYEPLGTSDLRKVIAILERKPIALLIASLETLGMKSAELIGKVRQLKPYLPIILISDRTHLEDLIPTLQYQIQAFFFKPLPSLPDLEKAVRQGIEKSQEMSKMEDLKKELSRLREELLMERKRRESELESREALYQTLFENTSDGIILIDGEGVVYDINQNATLLLGIQKSDIFNHPLSIYRDTYLERFVNSLLSLIRQPGLTQLEIDLPTRDGATRILQLHIIPVRYTTPHRFLIYLHDTTDFHHRLRSLQQRITSLEEQLEQVRSTTSWERTEMVSLLEDANVAIILFDQEGAVVEWNPAAERLTGYSRAQILKQPSLDFVITHYQELILPLLRREVLKEGKAIDNIEVEITTAQGERRFQRWNISPRREGREIKGVLAVAVDITAEYQLRKELENYSRQLETIASERTRELFQSQERFRHLFENNRDALFAANDKGEIIEVNAAWLKLLGFTSRQEAYGKHFLYDFIVSPTQANRLLTQLVARNLVEEELVGLRTASGDEITALITITAHFTNSSSLPTYEGIIRDVSHIKALEQKVLEHTKELEKLVVERSRLLAESEAKLRRLMENSPDILYRLEVNPPHFSLLSPAIHKITGYTEQEIQTISWERFLDLLHPEDREGYTQLLTRLSGRKKAKRGEKYRLEFRLLKRDGEVVWLEDNGIAIRNAAGELEALEGVIRDVTLQKKASFQLARQAEFLEAEVQKRTAELVESESRYRLLLAEAGDVIFTCDFQGKILDMNRRGEELLGKSVVELNKEGLTSFLDESSRRKFRKALRTCFQKGLKPDPFQIEYLTPAGTKLYIEIQASPILMKGKVMMVLNVGRDLTARRKASEAIRSLMAFNESILNSINEGIFVENRDGICEYVNPILERMLGYTSREMVGKHWSAFIPPEDREYVSRQSELRLQQGSNRYEAILQSKEGERIPVLISSRNRFSGDEITGGISIVTDLRDLKELERRQRFMEILLAEEKKLSDIGLKAAGIAHNINTPLLTIRGYAEFLMHRHPDMTELKIILDQALKIQEIVENIMAKSRHQQDKERKLININEFLETELKFLEANLFFKHKVVKKFHFDPAVPPIEGVWSELSQAITNIIDNALDAMFFQEKRELRVETKLVGDAIHLEIEDTGHGIPPDILPRIFDPFFTTKPLISEKKGEEPAGTGLGLSTAQQIIHRYGGRIEVASQLGVGTLFRIIFPVSSKIAQNA